MLRDLVNLGVFLAVVVSSPVMLFGILCGPARTRKLWRWTYRMIGHRCVGFARTVDRHARTAQPRRHRSAAPLA